jgi:hypothetical protein
VAILAEEVRLLEQAQKDAEAEAEKYMRRQARAARRLERRAKIEKGEPVDDDEDEKDSDDDLSITNGEIPADKGVEAGPSVDSAGVGVVAIADVSSELTQSQTLDGMGSLELGENGMDIIADDLEATQPEEPSALEPVHIDDNVSQLSDE